MSTSHRLLEHRLVERLATPDPKSSVRDMILDTDTFNEIMTSLHWSMRYCHQSV